MRDLLRYCDAVVAVPLPAAERAGLSAAESRSRFRSGMVCPTSGWSVNAAQANLVAVPAAWAFDVLLFAQRNPRPCPVLDVTSPGAHVTPLAQGADLRTDLPLYRIWRDGSLDREATDVADVWADDLVTFLLGCSFSFDGALQRAGVPVRHMEQGCNVPMYVTSAPCRAAGRLHGPLVVSMRPVPAQLVSTAVLVTAALTAVHGAPVHVGSPSALGIADLSTPDFGDAVRAEPGDIPVFWACGVTPQAVIMAAKPPFAITHAPGYMFITDLTETDIAAW
jgi:uncharacterized protein YcsI (UPF0317 family)